MLIFARVVDAGGFSAAAKALSLPVSNISRRVTRLEADVGVRLLERTTRSMRLTELGAVFYRHCKRVQEEALLAEQAVSRHLDIPCGTLRVSASVTTGIHMISPLLPKFLEAWPEVRVHCDWSNRRVDLIEEGFDVAVRVGNLESSSMKSKRLGVTAMGLYASPAYLLQHGDPKDVSELKQHQILAMGDMTRAAQFQLSNGDETTVIELQPRMVINDFTSLQRLLLAGAGLGPLPEYMCRDTNLERVLPQWRLPSVSFSALYPGNRGMPPKLRVFLDMLSEAFHTRGKSLGTV